MNIQNQISDFFTFYLNTSGHSHTAMKRQNSLTSSSSCRDAQEKLQTKTIGCMSGIIQLVCKAHSPRKFLTLGKKQTKNVTIPSLSPSPEKTQQEATSKGKERRSTCYRNRHSCELPRSPTLPAEIRRSNSANCLENIPTPPALVARLMGLEESAPPISSPRGNPDVNTYESLTEKRLRLLGALQKCDEDLKALKKIIEAVQSVEHQRTLQQPPRPVTTDRDQRESFVNEKITTSTVCTKTWLDFKGEQQQPSPVSVLDDFNKSPLSLRSYSSKRETNDMVVCSGRVQAQQKQQYWKKKPGEEEMNSTYFLERITNESVLRKNESRVSSTWNSKAMVESVEEVSRDIAWGQKREMGRIALSLQDNISRDLIEEIVRELGCFCLPKLHFRSCKRRLSF